MKRASTDPLLLLALVLTLAFNVMPSTPEFWRGTFDGETHLFFADHYRRGWWDPWEEKWSQGFWVYSYPPLVHQLIAAVGSASSLGAGFRLVQSAAMLLYPVAAWSLSRELQGPQAAGWASLLTLAPAGIYLAVYSFGQLPTLVGIVLMLFALTCLAQYLRTGRTRDLLSWGLLSGTLFAAHHLTAVFGLLPAAGAVALHVGLRRGLTRSEAGRRAASAAGTLIAAALFAVLPFWWWFFTQRIPFAEIPHPTRLAFLTIPELRSLFVFRIYGAALALVPLTLLWPLRRRSAWPLAALLVVWMILGLGGNTGLPQRLLGSLWSLMVYDRFALFAAALTPLAAAEWVASMRARDREVLAAVFLAGAMIMSAISAAHTENRRLLPRLSEWEHVEMRRFLEADDHANWYYVTLGLGDNEFQHLSRITSARTIDGYYASARLRRELRESRIGSFDASLHFPNGLTAVRSVLEQPASWNLRWALVADPRYDPTLQQAGWRRLYPLGADATWQAGDPVPSLVMIWSAPEGVPPIPRQTPPRVPPILPVLWGVMPIVGLAGGVLSLVLGSRSGGSGSGPAN